jgi:hypothetical protein
VRASQQSSFLHDPRKRKTPTCLSRPPEGRCGRARGCETRRARFRRGGLRLRPRLLPRLLPGLRRRCRRTRPRAFAAASRRTTPRTRGRAWTESCFGCAARVSERSETGVSATKRSRARRRRRARDLVDGARAGTHNAAMRFTTLQKMSVTMLSLYGERRLTTAPSRTYGMAPAEVSSAPRASNSDDDDANPFAAKFAVRCERCGVSEISLLGARRRRAPR